MRFAITFHVIKSMVAHYHFYVNRGGNMSSDEIRAQLKTACHFFGNQKTVALAAGIDNSNFGKWLKGSPTLSEDKLNRVLMVMGIPNFTPDADYVHVWQYTDPPAQLTDLDMVPAFRLYFPNGAEIAKAPWAKKGVNQIKRALITPWKQPRATYAITDGNVRAIMRFPTPGLIQKRNINSFLKWRDGTEEQSILNITDEENWVDGTPSIDEFDAVWSAPPDQENAEDLIKTVREQGITFGEAIRRIKTKK